MNITNSDLIEVLDSLGFSMKHKGYMYIMESVKMVNDNPFSVNNIRGDVYRVVAENSATTIANVDRLIRYSIEQAMQRVDDNAIMKYFSSSCIARNAEDIASRILNPTIFIIGLQKYFKNLS